MTAENVLRLPPIALAELPEKTKDYILGRASYLKCSPEEVIIAVLDRAAGACPPPAVFAGTSESEAATVPMAA